MKKGLINEAFRLQQLAGIAPINEIGQGMPSVASDLQTVGISPGDSISWVKYEGGSEKFNQGTAQQLIDLVNQKLKSAGYEYDFFAEPSEFTDFAQYGEGLTSVCSIAVGDTYQFDIAKGMSRGLQKEYITSAEESITEAFQKAGIDLNRPVICISDFGSHSVEAPKKISGGKLLQDLEAERVAYLKQDPDFDQTEGIQFEYGPEPGDGLLGDDEDAVQGLDCKLIVLFSDSHLYEIWQAKGMSRGMQKEGETEGLYNEVQDSPIVVLKDLYYFDKLNMIASMSDVDSKYEDYGSIVFKKGDVIKPGTEEYDMILDSPSLEANIHYK